MARHTQGATTRSGRVCKRPGSTRSAYVYAVLVDGVVRYVGKGRNGRMYSHLIEAKRSAARCAPDTSGLYPRMHRKLVDAVRAGSQVTESAIVPGLTDKAAYRLESRIIGEFHKHRAGQLWNTIDERFMDPRFLPDEWDDPEHPLYKLPRPLVRSSHRGRNSYRIAHAIHALQATSTRRFLSDDWAQLLTRRVTNGKSTPERDILPQILKLHGIKLEELKLRKKHQRASYGRGEGLLARPGSLSADAARRRLQ
jgi:hypothetical protein